MTQTVFSDAFRQNLQHGKYTHWARDLSEEELRCVLSIVAEFAYRSLPILKLLGDHRQELRTSIRGVLALEALARMVSLGERFDVDSWARRITRMRSHLVFKDLPEPVTDAIERAAPEVAWELVLETRGGYQLGGKDATGERVGACVSDDGRVVVKKAVEEADVPEVVLSAVKSRMPSFDLRYIHACGPDRQTVHSYEFVVGNSRAADRVLVSADGKVLEVSEASGQRIV